MKRILITGASGYLGWFCGQDLGNSWKTYSTYHTKEIGVHPNALKIQADLTQKDEVWKLLKTVKPEAVLHLAAHSGTAYCEENAETTRRLNVQTSSWLAEMCGERKAKLVFTSSEQIFDGKKGQYLETDTPNPKNKYGVQKWSAEQSILNINPQSIVVRIAVLFGLKTPSSQSFLTQWIHQWRTDEVVNAFHDETRSFLSVTSCVDGLIHLLDQQAEGIFHLGGSRAVSRYDFATFAKKSFGITTGQLIKKSQQEVDLKAFRPADLSLNCNKIKASGFLLSDPFHELSRLSSQTNL